MKSIACVLLKIVLYVLEFALGVFLFPVMIIEPLIWYVEEIRSTLSSEGERSDPSKREGDDGRPDA